MLVPFCSKNVYHNRLQLKAREKGIPFYCDTCGVIDFPFKAIRDIIFVWRDKPPSYIGDEKIIEIPAQFREYYRNEWGYILSAGPGYYNKKGYIPINPYLISGQRIIYNKEAPWEWKVKDSKGIPHTVMVLGEQDILAVYDKTDRLNTSKDIA